MFVVGFHLHWNWKNIPKKSYADRDTGTVGGKIIRALEIVHVRKLIPNAVLWKKHISNHDL